MKKNSLFFFALIFVFFGCKSTQTKETGMSSLISFGYEGKVQRISKANEYTLDSEEFDLYFDWDADEYALCLFAHYKPTYQHKYTLPIACDDTEIFPLGSGRAEYPLDPSKGYVLTVSDSESFSYIFGDRKIDTENGFMLPVRTIADMSGKYDGDIYISFFSDFNKNRMIEQDEYATLTLHIH